MNRQKLPTLMSGLAFVLLFVACGGQQPSYGDATSPETCVKNVILAANAKDATGQMNSFTGETRELLVAARPLAASAAVSANELRTALQSNNLSRSAEALAQGRSPDSFGRFDNDIFSQFTCAEKESWTVSPKSDTTATARICGMDYLLILESDRWRLRPNLPLSLAWTLPSSAPVIMGPQGWLVDSGKVTFKDIQPRLGAIQDAKAMLDELTRAVRSGAFKSDQAFVTQYNSMVQQLESK
jgi:hypothetical protein